MMMLQSVIVIIVVEDGVLIFIANNISFFTVSPLGAHRILYNEKTSVGFKRKNSTLYGAYNEVVIIVTITSNRYSSNNT
jgi:hypothetical protein